MKNNVIFLAAAFVASTPAHAALVTGPWALGQGAATLTNENTASPTVGDGTANNADATSVYSSFSSVTLSNVGDKITLAGTVTLSSIVANRANDFRWSLYDAAGSPDTSGWLGYIVGNSNATTNSNLWERVNPNTGIVMATGSGAANVIHNTSGSPGVQFASDTFDLIFSLERTALGGLLINSSLLRTSDSVQFGLISAFTDTTPETYTFNRVGFLASGNLDADQVQFSNVDLTFVPEPSAALLGCLASLVLLRRRRRS